MKTSLLFSEFQIHQWIEEMQQLHQDLLQLNIPFSEDQVIPEDRVCHILGVTSRTMRTYRKQHYLRYFKMEGRVYYLKIILYVDLILLSEKSRES